MRQELLSLEEMGVREGRNRLLGRVGGPSAWNWIEQESPGTPLNESAEPCRLRLLKPRPLADPSSPALPYAFHVELDDLIQDFSLGFSVERVTQGPLPASLAKFLLQLGRMISILPCSGCVVFKGHKRNPSDTYIDGLIT